MIYLHLECQRWDDENYPYGTETLNILTSRFSPEGQYDSMVAQSCANTLMLINPLNTMESVIKGVESVKLIYISGSFTWRLPSVL